MKLFGITLFQEKTKKLENLYRDLFDVQFKINQSAQENQKTLKKIDLAKNDLNEQKKSIDLLT